MSSSAVQTYLANKLTNIINEKFDAGIHINRLGLNWKGEVDVRDIYIEDHYQDTLIYSKRLVTNILSINNLVQGNLDFGIIKLEEPKFYLKTYEGEQNDNVSIFANKFVSKTSKKRNVFQLNARAIHLNNGKVKIINENLDTSEIFNLSKIVIETDDLSVKGPAVNISITKLSLIAKRGFEIKNF